MRFSVQSELAVKRSDVLIDPEPTIVGNYTDVEKTQGEEAQKSVAPPPTAQTVWTSGALDGAICTLWQYN